MSTVTLVHVSSASLALVLGAWQLIAAKRGLRHRRVGYAWLAAMLVASLSSFGLRSGIGPAWLGGFSPIHALSVFTLASLALALRFAIGRDIRRHRRWVAGAYAGLVVAALFAVAVPGRQMNRLLFAGLHALASDWSGVPGSLN
jgi:uncharacterized membrane protein